MKNAVLFYGQAGSGFCNAFALVERSIRTISHRVSDEIADVLAGLAGGFFEAATFIAREPDL